MRFAHGDCFCVSDDEQWMILNSLNVASINLATERSRRYWSPAGILELLIEQSSIASLLTTRSVREEGHWYHQVHIWDLGHNVVDSWIAGTLERLKDIYQYLNNTHIDWSYIMSQQRPPPQQHPPQGYVAGGAPTHPPPMHHHQPPPPMGVVVGMPAGGPGGGPPSQPPPPTILQRPTPPGGPPTNNSNHANNNNNHNRRPANTSNPNTGIPYGHVPGYLPGSSSLVEELDQRLLIVLRDGRHVLGVRYWRMGLFHAFLRYV